MMEITESIFSHLCGQARCFVVDGVDLSVCQRCFGLYSGAAITGLWLLLSGIRRRGLPSRKATIANTLILLTAMASGLHVVDGGPTWRLICGLWTGHVVMLWLVGGTVRLRQSSSPRPFVPPNWRTRDTLQALAAPLVLAAAAGIFCVLHPPGWTFWTALVLLGAIFLLIALAAAITSVVSLASNHGPLTTMAHPLFKAPHGQPDAGSA